MRQFMYLRSKDNFEQLNETMSRKRKQGHERMRTRGKGRNKQDPLNKSPGPLCGNKYQPGEKQGEI